MSAKYRLLVKFGQNRPTQRSHGLFATAKLRVDFRDNKQFTTDNQRTHSLPVAQ